MVTARAVSSGGREGWVVMQRETFFAERWPLMVPQLRAALAKAGAGPDDRDDLVQETAVRLLGMWDRIDWERPVEALAQRIAVNAWRDQWRRRGEREQLGELPEQASAADTERAALARVQVGEVARAFTTLGEGVVRTLRLAARDAEDPDRAGATAAVRMARTRARRALLASVNIASGFAAVVAACIRWVRRPARVSVASLSALAAFCFAAAAPVGVPHQHTIATQPERPADVSVAHVVARTAGAALNPVAHRAAAVVQHAQSRAGHVPLPYYKIGAGNASVRVFVTVDMWGHGVKVEKPRPGTVVPVCTFGSTPDLPGTTRCAK